ncbi:MAG: hypothetical protein JO303_05760 [Caulobacteraceae bacterium]|nr:hypothetical protein [Caulobacteraceae bacterium]
MSDVPVTPDEDTATRVHNVLEGVEGLTSVTDAAAILADVEAVEVVAEPLDGVLAVVGMMLGVWEALETPHRTLAYQGYSYGLLRRCAGMSDPTPNPGWPDPADIENDYSDFNSALAKAKSDAQDTKLRNQILLAMAKFGAQEVLKAVWDKVIPDEDHLMRMFTPQWPDVAPG